MVSTDVRKARPFCSKLRSIKKAQFHHIHVEDTANNNTYAHAHAHHATAQLTASDWHATLTAFLKSFSPCHAYGPWQWTRVISGSDRELKGAMEPEARLRAWCVHVPLIRPVAPRPTVQFRLLTINYFMRASQPSVQARSELQPRSPFCSRRPRAVV